MDNLLTMVLEAHNADLNHHRRYEIRVGRDLFADWVVNISYGRARKAGRQRQHGGPDAAELQKIIRLHLNRRLSAPKRIGCSYRLKELSSLAGFDADAWLPKEILAQFAP